MSGLRIKLKAYDHRVIDQATVKIVETLNRSGVKFAGPIPLPTKIEKFTVTRAPFRYKDSREQFEMRTHKRLIDIMETKKEVMDALVHLELPSGVNVEIKEIKK